MRGVRRFFSREKQVFLVGFSLTFPGFPRKSKIRLNTSLQEGRLSISFSTLLLLKRRPWHRCFPVNFGTFLKTPFLWNTSRRLLCICRLIRNITISCNCRAQFYKSSVNGHFYFSPID